MLARRVQRCSLVDGGNFPGSTNAPITPPSYRMVRPGAWTRCARVAANSGMPTPAKTTCPSRSSRALTTASNSLAVQVDAAGSIQDSGSIRIVTPAQEPVREFGGQTNSAAIPLLGRLIPLFGGKIPLFGSVAEFR